MLIGTARRIVVVGSVNIDRMLRCPQLPAAGETVLGEDLLQAPGGKGANQAVAAARLGAEVAFIGCIGDDAFGEQAAAALRAEGIDIRHLQRCPGLSTGVAMVLSDSTGENCIALAPGANLALTPAHIDAAAHLFDGAALVVCQLESPLASVQHAAEVARHHGVPLLLNPAPAQPLPAALLQWVDLLVPNAHEAAALCAALPGHVAMRHVAAPTEVLRQAAGHAAALRLAGAGHVIVTCGGNSAVLDRQRRLAEQPRLRGHGAGHHRRRRLLRRRLGRSAGRRPSLAAGHRAGATCSRLQRRAPRRTGSHAASRRPARLELKALTCIPKSR